MSKLPYVKLQAGDVINDITIESYAYSKKAARWMNCVCHCGEKFVAQSSRLKSGHTKSCGCLRKNQLSARNKAGAGSLRQNHKKRADAQATDLPVGIMELTRTEHGKKYKVLGIRVDIGNGEIKTATRNFGRKRTREQAIRELQRERERFHAMRPTSDPVQECYRPDCTAEGTKAPAGMQGLKLCDEHFEAQQQLQNRMAMRAVSKAG